MSFQKRISDLINAGFGNKAIVNIIGCHILTVNQVQAKKKEKICKSPLSSFPAVQP